ncbi:MAG: ribosome small subunit-dependent GTPase A [Firmicutes bacterium]|nr:ribosome small subunit-dependent GTPase A [Bacillota bacterium]
MNRPEGTIMKGIAGFYYVKSGDDVYRCKARGIFKQRDIKPAVGDRVSFEILEGNDDSWITHIHERKNSFIRPFIANVDCFVIVVAAAKPAPVPAVIDKLTVMAEKKDTDVIICVNKCDLAEGDSKGARKASASIDEIRAKYDGIYPVVTLDSLSGSGFESLKKLIRGKRVALAGPSGVGKSTITNRLIPEAAMETGDVSEKTQRGRHTTRHSELFPIDDGDTMIFDTPGFTSFEILDVDETELQHLYPEIAELTGRCRYGDCYHLSEPGCAVREAVHEGSIHRARYDSYVEQIGEIRKKKQY